jgi:hypothetical protein
VISFHEKSTTSTSKGFPKCRKLGKSITLLPRRELEQQTRKPDTIANVALRDFGITPAYLAVFLFLSWYAFRRAQIIESA